MDAVTRLRAQRARALEQGDGSLVNEIDHALAREGVDDGAYETAVPPRKERAVPKKRR